MSDISRLANPGRLLSALVTSFMLATPHVVIAQDDQPAEDIRAIIEGTWELIEWYVDGQILRVPEMDGRWMVHDGMVMATRHRDGVSGYETTAGYGDTIGAQPVGPMVTTVQKTARAPRPLTRASVSE